MASAGRVQAQQQAAQRALARCRRPDQRDGVAGRDCQRIVLQHRAAGTRRGIGHVIDGELAGRLGQERVVRLGRQQMHARLQAAVAEPCRREVAPCPHCRVQRRQRPAEQDRRRDHAATGQLALEHKHGPQADHRLGLLVGRDLGDARFKIVFLGKNLNRGREHQQEEDGPHREHAQHRMLQPDQRNERRNPGHVEEHRQCRRAHEALDLAEVAQRLGTVTNADRQIDTASSRSVRRRN